MLESSLLLLLGSLAIGLVFGVAISALVARSRRRHGSAIIQEAENHAARQLQEAEREARRLKEAAVLEGKAAALALREEVDREASKRREELNRAERRLEQRDQELNRKRGELGQIEAANEKRNRALTEQEAAVQDRLAAAEALVAQRAKAVEAAAGLSAEDAKRELLVRVENEARTAAQALARDIKEQARREADKDAKKILAVAIQRLAAETTATTTVAAVALASDEQKGRIIGREGRNIRAFETATGVDVIIDDTPDTVVLSCYDPIRREVARRALSALLADGRIHPGRIEEVVAGIRKELDAELTDWGERAAFETGIHGLHPELLKLVGRMQYRTSYGQNIYEHSKEVAWLAGMMAAELHLNVALARRGGLLHDIGKVLTHDNEGTHVELGVEVATRYGEKPEVIGCIAAHHDDVPHETAESVLVQAADAISGSRPGARRESFETYVKRLTKLEELANSFSGVEKSNVIQAGREVRVVVYPDKVDDAAAVELSETIARRIESELQYPGQIKVTVIRETRATGVAK